LPGRKIPLFKGIPHELLLQLLVPQLVLVFELCVNRQSIAL
jgi:hypothetical protein